MTETGYQGQERLAENDLDVALKEPMDLPWKAPMVEIIPVRFVCRRASFNAPSTDSVPLLVKKQYCKSPGVIMANNLASIARRDRGVPGCAILGVLVDSSPLLRPSGDGADIKNSVTTETIDINFPIYIGDFGS